jgi:fructokinase
MPSVCAIGETVYDIIFRNEQPVAAKAGGSMLNAAVSLGRCGVKVEMITELGNDRVGDIVLDFLHENRVATSCIHPVVGFKTPVSLAFLNENGDARYSFYKDYPAKRLKVKWPAAGEGDVILFGSFYSLDDRVRSGLIPFLEKAKANGALLVYDPNIRKNHLEEIRKLMPLVEENIALASLVRGSDEDFANLFGMSGGEEVFRILQGFGTKCLVLTRGPQGAELLTHKLRLQIPAREVQVVSTIGAGDSFNAGLIFGILQEQLSAADLLNAGEKSWKTILGLASDFAADATGSFDNYISLEMALKLRAVENRS